jgi:hypothetical protein
MVFSDAACLGQGLLLHAASNAAAPAHSGQCVHRIHRPRIAVLLAQTKSPRVVAARDDRDSKAWRGF